MSNEKITYEAEAETCLHENGVNPCSGFKGDGTPCSHCKDCGTQL